MKKRLIALSMFLLMAVSAGYGYMRDKNIIGQPGGGPRPYTLLTGSSGAQYFTIGTAMADSINNNSDKIEVSALTSTGVSEVLNLVQRGEADFGFITYDTGYLAASSQREYTGMPPYDNIRLVMLGHTGQKTIVTYANSPYKTLGDAKGARIASASGTQSHALDTAAFRAWGVNFDDQTVVIMGYGEMATAMKDRVVDICCPHGPNPSSYIIDMASTNQIRILGQTQESLAAILRDHPEWIASTIPAGTYKGVDYDVLTFANYSAIVCRPDIPEEDVMEFLRIVFDTDLTRVYSYGDTWGRNNKHYGSCMKNVAILPFHLGAMTFLREEGMITDDMLK